MDSRKTGGYPRRIPRRPAEEGQCSYQNADGAIANYYPDFIVKRTEAEIWIVETKGREDLDDPLKWERLKQWCRDASQHDPAGRKFHPLFVRQEAWEEHRPANFARLIAACRDQ